MQPLHYASGELVQVGDTVALGSRAGPLLRVVVVIGAGEAAPGFKAEEWAYLKRGAMLQDSKVFGLLHVETFDSEYEFVGREGS